MKEMVINGVKVRPGQSMNIDIAIARLPTHTLIDLPIFINRAKDDGPVVLISGGVHGDEINGIVAVRRMLEENLISLLKGTVIFMPLVNVYGFLSNSRTFPDGRDLNRSFPGNKKGSLASQIAFILSNEIIPLIDYGIDFHTGGRMLSNYPQIRVDYKDKKGLELATAFGTHYILNSPHIDKSFRKEAYKRRKHILVYEGGESMRLDDYAVEEALLGTQRMLIHLGMIEGDVASKATIMISESSWVRAKVSGIFTSTVSLGDEVKKGQILAKITDPYGQVKVPVKAIHNGHVVGLNNNPVVNSGDALVHVGRV
ncbi:succinylglutamate desuccinylase/aspartoacylase family protein [Aquiflexum sp. LQ15W]|jgi:predicted deacylase|uniref:succinylglutamate desuccinylase/aspartoacylase family protein n=1 Tax=Cognataquiflexum nitidum TaxID=2922272 RepID=UPI001F137071|nr:succinylglutamate desuccinylase/aspartoacylase family protein [Cognataquiflexum nitidum]MCH6200459.1 succinylglutamate desuccinylase/aspartoacylase family protein [Cognataquiflexum nitidum]